jgi:hypothetical protein
MSSGEQSSSENKTEKALKGAIGLWSEFFA